MSIKYNNRNVGVTLGGGGGGATLQQKSYTSAELQTILNGTLPATLSPDQGYDGFSSITITPSPLYEWTLHSKYTSSGLSSSGWVDDSNTYSFTRDGGTWQVSDGKLVADNAYYSVPNPAGYFLVGIKCSIASGFTPVSSTSWYQQSAIFGRELGGQQNDWACTLYGGLQPCIGYGFSSYKASGMYLTANQDYEIFLLHTNTGDYLFVDGTQVTSVSYTPSSGNFSQMGVFWNKDNANTRVQGTISKLGIWTFTKNSSGTIVLPTL